MPGTLSSKFKREVAQDEALAERITLLDAFVPNKGNQELVFLSKKHIVWMFSSNKWGKSYIGTVGTAYNTIPEKDRNGNNTGWLLNPYIRKRVPAKGIEAWISCWSEDVFKETLQPTFDQFFRPYIKNEYSESGIRQWIATEIATIHIKSQNADSRTYEGANIDWCYCDEPHKQTIYNAILSRFAKTRGYLWFGGTLVVDPDDPEALTKLKAIEWMVKIAEEWERDPSLHPELEIVYGSIEENPHIDAEFQLRMWSGLSEQELLTRRTGHYYSMIGRSAFNKEILTTIDQYLKAKDESIPEYGMLGYEETSRGDYQVYFHPSAIQDFPDKPADSFIFKIWQHPVSFDSPLIRPEYYIGADAAEGKQGGDYSCAYVIRADTKEIVACLHGYLSELEFARQLYLLGMYYCNKDHEPARLAIEVTAYGKTTQAYMIHGNAELSIPRYGISRLYHRPLNSDMERGLLIIGSEPGWYTSSKTRPFIISAVRQILIECYEAIKSEQAHTLIYDKGLIFECAWFISDKNGKFGAVPGKSTDDRIFAAGIARKCMEQYYHPRPSIQRVAKNEDDFFYENGQIVWNMEKVLSRERDKAKRPKQLVY